MSKTDIIVEVELKQLTMKGYKTFRKNWAVKDADTDYSLTFPLDARGEEYVKVRLSSRLVARTGQVIPYTEIKGRKYVELDWLISELAEGERRVRTPKKPKKESI